MGEKNIWERIKDSSNCRVLILNLILTLCLNLLLEFTERRSVSEVFSFVQERTQTEKSPKVPKRTAKSKHHEMEV